MNESTDDQFARTTSDRHVIIQIIKSFYFNLEVTKGETFSNFCLGLKLFSAMEEWTRKAISPLCGHWTSLGPKIPMKIMDRLQKSAYYVFPANSETFHFEIFFVCLFKINLLSEVSCQLFGKHLQRIQTCCTSKNDWALSWINDLILVKRTRFSRCASYD